MLKSFAVVGVVAAVVAVIPGCTVTEQPAPVYASQSGYTAGVDAEVEVDTPPPVVEIESAPRYVYRGQDVYFYNDRWYHRRGNRWVYYRNEPPELRRHRGDRRRPYVQSAPPVEEHHEHHHDRD